MVKTKLLLFKKASSPSELFVFFTFKSAITKAEKAFEDLT